MVRAGPCRAELGFDRAPLQLEKRPGRDLPLHELRAVPSASRRSAYWLYEPVCCCRVAWASPAIVLLAFAAGTIAAVRLRAAKAARIMFFIEILSSCDVLNISVDSRLLVPAFERPNFNGIYSWSCPRKCARSASAAVKDIDDRCCGSPPRLDGVDCCEASGEDRSGDAVALQPEAGGAGHPQWAFLCWNRRFELLAMPHLDAALDLSRWLIGNTEDAGGRGAGRFSPRLSLPRYILRRQFPRLAVARRDKQSSRLAE
jgi:hypothetical protein